jgi:hypothetical protein
LHPERSSPERVNNAVRKSPTRSNINSKPSEDSVTKQTDFVLWCQQLLGIHTLLEVKTFTYPDYMQLHYANHWAQLEEAEEDDVPVEQLDLISVRGLAAKRDIAIGEVVISIPLHAIISIPTTVDHDPVLSRVLGKKERDRLGWNDPYFELPLLTVAILHHIHTLGPHSPISQYMQILISTATNQLPVLWDRKRLQKDTTEGVYKIVRGIQKDVNEMYEAVVPILLRDHPNVFAESVLTLKEFTWAFALVNSRHWQLPLPNLEETPSNTRDEIMTQQHLPSDLLPPADMPTEDWVSERGDAPATDVPSMGHSFLAPLADLLNFGPPCTRGQYSADSFELVTTCSYLKGQEVTFWYSNDCDDVIIANYGFAHPMVPSCHLMDSKHSRYSRQIQALEEEVDHANQELETLEVELGRVSSLLKECHCDEMHEPMAATTRKRTLPTKLRPDTGIRGHTGKEESEDDGKRHGVRRQRQENRKSDLGL